MPGHRFTPAEMLARLVAFDTTSRNSNLELIEWVADYLRGHGLEPLVMHDETGSKANLFATVGPEDVGGGVVLSGHSDVVPVDGQPWSSDPFRVIERDGRLYGRGTADMKGFLAAVLAQVPSLAERPLTAPVHVALTYDEEVTCAGVQHLVPELRRLGYRPGAVVIGEPTSMRVVNAHKGIFTCRTRIVGREAHSSLTNLGVNAIVLAARMLGRLEQLAEAARTQGLPLEGVDPPYTTVNVGTIRGGTQFNIIARDCEINWEMRPCPGFDGHRLVAELQSYAEELLAEARKVAPEASIETEIDHGVAAFTPEEDSPAERLVTALTGANRPVAVGYFTEAPFFQAGEMSTVVFGPGSIEQAHKPDEFIELSQLAACERFVQALGEHLQGS